MPLEQCPSTAHTAILRVRGGTLLLLLSLSAWYRTLIPYSPPQHSTQLDNHGSQVGQQGNGEQDIGGEA